MRIVYPFVIVMWGCTAPFPALGPAFDTGVSDAADVGAPLEDALPRDAGPIDIGSPDARAPDALPVDARAPDAQPVDANVDASPVDATIDAQTPDAGPPPIAPLITEVVTANRGSLRDSDGATPDWIELHNPTGAALPIGAFTLSDDEDGAGWPLPEATLAPFETRIVFASGADRRGAEWHADFRLGSAGEVLRLTTLDGATVQRLDIPALGADVAFGLPAVPVVAVDEGVRYRSPGFDDGWTDPAYDDSAWMIAPQGIGVDEPGAASMLDHQRERLLADWRFDGAVDDIVADGAAAHPGVLGNGAALDPAGRDGSALSGAGDGWMAARDPEGFDFAEAFTWSIWLKGVDDSGALISRNPAGTGWNQGSKALFVRGGTVQWDSGWVGNPRTGVNVTDDVWHHVAVTYDPAGDAFGIWVDGVQANDSVFNVDLYAEDLAHNGGEARTGLFVGRANFTGGLPSLDKYAGLIDDVTLWDVALPPADIALLAQGVRPGRTNRFGDRITTRLPEDTLPAEVRIAWPAAPWLALNLTADVVPSAQLWIDGAPVDPLNAPAQRGLPAGATALAIAVNGGADRWLVRATVDGLHAQPAVLERPTPGVFNAAGLSPPVTFSRADGVFEDAFMLTLESAAEVVHYTLDGREPTRESPQYAEPIAIESTVQVRARGFDPERAPSRVAIARFVQISPGLADLQSPIPIMVIERFGQGVPGRGEADGMLLTFEAGAGLRQATVASRTMVRLRGQSSANQPKRPYRLELRDELGNDRALPLLGMPAEADWVLHAPYTDQSLIRNALVYSLGRDLGMQAPRTAFCQLFVHTGDEPMRLSDLQGVYVLVETIEIGEDRLDITQMRPNDLAEPAISGGYLLKFEASVARAPLVDGFDSLELDSPDPATPAQSAWIADWLAALDATLDLGVLPEIDVASFVDLMVINELFRDQDAYVRSAWFYKDRGQPLRAGPLWDYNLVAGTGGFFDNTNIAGYQWQHPYNMGEAEWFSRLMDVPEFAAAFRDRWVALRGGLLSDAAISARIDALAAEVGPVANSNFRIWDDTLGEARVNGFVTPGAYTWAGQIDELRSWLVDRAAWIDANP